MNDETQDRLNVFTVSVIIIGIMLAILLSLGACSPTAGATRAVRGLQQLRDLTAKQLAAMVHARNVECLAKHAPKTAEYADCIKEPREWLRTWQEVVRPAVNSAAAVGVAALKTEALVRKCKADGNCTKVVIALLKPGVCAITRALKAFGHKLPDKGASLLGIVGMIEGVACQ